MRVLIINVVCGSGSTGKICAEQAEALTREGHQAALAYGRGTAPQIHSYTTYKIGGCLNAPVHALRARLLDGAGFGSAGATRRFLKWADQFDPELLWLHNLHGYYIHVPLLFQWIKNRANMETKWMLHDCWAFTGHCAQFSAVRCDKWKTLCNRCPQKARYPASWLLDRSTSNYLRKQQCCTGVEPMTLVVPSRWMAALVRDSFLAKYPIALRPHRVDPKVFHKRESDFRRRYHLEGRWVLLGVASDWADAHKGLGDFLALASILDARYALVLVGVSRKIQRRLPRNILGIGPISEPERLAELYSAADVYLNLSREESFGLTTLEALSCGTKTIVYQNTACAEIAEAMGGVAVEQHVDCVKAMVDRLVSSAPQPQPPRRKGGGFPTGKQEDGSSEPGAGNPT